MGSPYRTDDTAGATAIRAPNPWGEAAAYDHHTSGKNICLHDAEAHPGAVVIWSFQQAVAVVAKAVLSDMAMSMPDILVAVVVFIALAIGAASVILPTPAACALAAIVVANAAAVATDSFGAPPLIGLLAPAFAALLLVRRSVGLEDLSGVVRVTPYFGLYFGSLAISILWVENVAPTLSRLIIIGKDLLFLFIIVGFITNIERLRAVVWTIASTAALIASLSLFQYATGQFEQSFFGFAQASIKGITDDVMSWRLHGPLSDPNYYGQLLVTTLPLVLTMAFAAHSHVLRFLGLVGAPIVVIVVFLTYSRGAVAGLAVLAIFAILMSNQRLIVLGSVVVTVVLAAAASPTMMLERLAPIVQAGQAVLEDGQSVEDPALAQRLSVMRTATAIFLDAPVFGVGTGQFAHLYPSYALIHGADPGAPPEAHSRFLETAAEGGVVGVLFLFSFIGVVVVICLHMVKRFECDGARADALLMKGLLWSFLGYLATSVFLHGAYERVSWLIVGLIVASPNAIASVTMAQQNGSVRYTHGS